MGKWKCLLLVIFLVPRSIHCNKSLDDNDAALSVIMQLDDILLNIAQEHNSLYTSYEACSDSVLSLEKEERRTEDEYEHGLSTLDKIREDYNGLREVYLVACGYRRNQIRTLLPSSLDVYLRTSNIDLNSVGTLDPLLPPLTLNQTDQDSPNDQIKPTPPVGQVIAPIPYQIDYPPPLDPIENPVIQPRPINPPTNYINPPTNIINPPTNNINPPKNNTNPPTNNINPPTNNTNPPKNNTNPPKNNTNPPKNNINPPKNNTNPPENKKYPCKCYQYKGYPGCYFPTKCRPSPKYRWYSLPFYPWGFWYPKSWSFWLPKFHLHHG